MAFRTFGGLGQFLLGELEPASAAAGWFHYGTILRMLQAAQQVLQIVRDLAWRFFNFPGDLGDAHRISEQQINQIFAEHDTSPRFPEEPIVCLQVVLEQILPFVGGQHLEIIGSWPLRFAFHLVPPVEDFTHLDGPCFPSESPRCLIRLGSGVAFDLNRDKFHFVSFRKLNPNLVRCRPVFRPSLSRLPHGCRF